MHAGAPSIQTDAARTGHGHTGHRRDIDGLRALAILPVLFFHAHVPGFSGGYVGVDIFFVISGFLITGIISREMDKGRFSLIQFYARRFRRIIPALTLMMMTVLAMAAILYLPGDLESVPRSALAATLFLSNLWFFTDTGYFAGGADVKPLLHTWSLAVEEQYYIAFPLLLMGIARWAPRWRTVLLWAATAASLALCVAMRRDTSGFAFYLPPTRAWELLAGALLALGAFPSARMRPVKEVLSWIGIGAIAAAVIGFDSHTPFPGIAALAPVIGAVLLLHSAPGSSVGRILSLPPLVGVGLLSYSLYLWHWPLIVFTEYVTDMPLSGTLRILVMIAAFVAAYLSWRFVERPFRSSMHFPAPRIFRFTALAMTLLSIASIALIAAGPWPARFSPAVLRMAAGREDFSPDRKRCHDTAMRGAKPCILGADVRPDALLWGDSHGAEMVYVLSLDARRQGRALIERTTSSCPPVLDYDATDPRCAMANRATFEAIRAAPAIRHIYLAAFWANGDYDDPGFVARLDRTIAALHAMNRDVTIIGPVPPQHFDVPRRLAHLARSGGDPRMEGAPRSEVMARTRHLRALFSRWQSRGVKLIDPIKTLCDSQQCSIEADTKPLYFDSHHLSVAGARWVIGD